MFCLSKGLGSPVGSLLVGSRKFIDEARAVRKSLGGGMRQAGVLAAAGLISLEKMTQRLQIDHDNARFLAQGLAEISGIKLDASKVVTNILVCDISGTGITGADFSRQLAERGVLANPVNPETMRFVTHYDVDRAGCERALTAVREVTRQPVPSAARA